MSIAISAPRPRMIIAASVALPPGAAQASTTTSPGEGFSAYTTRPAASSCTENWPLLRRPDCTITCSPDATRTNPAA
eukprot:scaffold3165_cov380-Prasinococcus_capsulatus_cf.AAC.6